MNASVSTSFGACMHGLRRWIWQDSESDGQRVEASSTAAYRVASEQMEYELMLADIDAFSATFEAAQPAKSLSRSPLDQGAG